MIWRRRLSVWSAVASALATGAAASGGTATWDGGAGTNRWADAANWSNDTLPRDDDVVILTGQLPRVDYTATLELGASRTAYNLAGNNLPAALNLVIGSAADVAAGNTLTLTNGQFDVAGPSETRVGVDLVLPLGAVFYAPTRLVVDGVVRSNSGFTVLGGATFTAATPVTGTIEDRPYVTPTGTAPGSITFSGANGSARQAGAFLVDGLVLDNRSAVNNDRVNDSASIGVGRSLSLLGNPTSPVAETVGDVAIGQGALLSVTATEAAPATLTMRTLERGLRAVGSVERTPGGSILVSGFRPPAIGGGGSAGSTSISVVPYLVAGGDRPVTYDLGPDGAGGTADDVGLRGLADGEFAPYAAAGPVDNAVLAGPAAGLAGKAVNSLRITAPAGGGATVVSGSGTLRVASGFLSAGHGSGSNASISGFDAIDFGTAEAVIRPVGPVPAAARLDISSPITGSGGLTVSGPGTLRLLGPHHYTGLTSVSSGALAVDDASGLGTPGGLGLQGVYIDGNAVVQALGTFTTARPFTVRSGGGIIRVDGGQTMTLAAPLTVNGPLRTEGPGTVVLRAATTFPAVASYTVASGTLLLDNPTGSATGSGSIQLEFRPTGGGTLGGDGATSASVGVSGTLSPGDANATGSLSTGALSLGASSTSLFQLGAPQDSDRVDVTGDLTIDGTLRLGRLDGFDAGTYTLFTYTGRLTDRTMTISPTFQSPYTYRLDTSTPGRLNLIVVPEPAVGCALAVMGMAAIALRPSRRTRKHR